MGSISESTESLITKVMKLDTCNLKKVHINLRRSLLKGYYCNYPIQLEKNGLLKFCNVELKVLHSFEYNYALWNTLFCNLPFIYMHEKVGDSKS